MRLIAFATLFLYAASSAFAGPLELKKGDHVCIIGNTLPERMQHHGWFETLLHHRYPDHDLVVRNLAYPGDEVNLRLRSQGFGTPEEHLKFNRAEVVFAFFGYNESFAGEVGLEKFEKELDTFVKDTLASKYNGKTSPQVVLFSPLANENLHDPNLPDGTANNERLRRYTAAVSKVAKSNDIVFVDLFAPSLEAYGRAKQPLTINGVHLNEHGDREIASAMDIGLFGPRLLPADDKSLAKLRQAVLDKNFIWFNRYRTVDGYSIFGGRADLKFTNGQTNRVVMARELEVLDAMTANRDKRIWAVAKGGDLTIDDNNTPPFLEVITNKPGPGPGSTYTFQSGEAAIAQMTVAKGMKVNLFASEEQFPELADPVQMSFDTRGRLWVAVMPSYPHWKPKSKMDDKLLIFEDTNGDGRADVCKTFAGGLHVPTGFEFYNGGVLVGQQPDLVFLKDTDGDDVADVYKRVLDGLDSADTHHAMNSFVLDPGGALYFQEGTFHHTQVETPYAPTVRSVNAGGFRYEPRTQKFEVYIPYAFANPHGHVFDHWGQDFITDGTGNVNYWATAFSGISTIPRSTRASSRSTNSDRDLALGPRIISSRHFPPENQGNYLDANVIGFQGIFQYKFRDDGAGFGADEVEPIVSSSDPNFRPSDMEIGPDGALYFLDWQNPIIGHMQHNLRDPSRDVTHGRVYRVTCEGRALLKPVKIAGEPIDKLLDLLKEPEDRVRYRVKIELGGRKSEDVVAAAKKWAAALDPKDPDVEHHLLEALWVHQYHNTVNVELLDRVLASPDYRARAAATRVLCYQRDRVPGAIEKLKALASDEHPRVRIEAARAASFFKDADAIEVVAAVSKYPTDYWLDYVRTESTRALEQQVKKELATGETIPTKTEAGTRLVLKNMTLDQILKTERTRPVFQDLLTRPGLRDEQRRDALAGLARLEKRSELAVLLDAVRSIDSEAGAPSQGLIFDLMRLLTGRSAEELGPARSELEQLAVDARQPAIRQASYVALMTVDGSVGRTWDLAAQSLDRLNDLVSAVPLVADVSQRAELYPRIAPLLESMPKSLSKQAAASPTEARYVRIELPGKGPLALVEVEAISGKQNVAPGAKSSQKGDPRQAKKAIDGSRKSSSNFDAESQTGDVDQPWWEIDLKKSYPLHAIVIYPSANLAWREKLDGFTLRLFDANGEEVFRREKIAAEDSKIECSVTGGEATELRRAAMNALVTVRGQELATFRALAKFVHGEVDRLAAIRALQRIGRQFWPKEDAQGLLDVVIADIRATPAALRTSSKALDEMEFAGALASLLPSEQGVKVRAELGELGVRVIKVGTLLERMSYDKDMLVVKAGKRVEFVFSNSDFMPHNFVITEPGAMEEVGLSAEETAQQPGAAKRNYVPKSNRILLASKLLQPRESQKLSFAVPKKPGVYPYVCTYPGHWRRMYGALYVVADYDAYEANPEAYLASHPLEIKDELLKDRRPRTEWKFDDLAEAVTTMKARSYSSGKQMFAAANCVACHRLDNVGNTFGPDLTKLEPKVKPLDILREVLDPSAKINEKFQTYVFQTSDGTVVTGIVVEETPSRFRVIENPLAKAEPMTIKKADIEAQEKSPVSIMPKGLLDKLTKDEILDLIAYLASRGDHTSALFEAAGAHHSH